MGTDGPQAEENTIAADAHRIAPVQCDEKEFFVFLAEALKKNTVCPVVRKRPAKFCTPTFDFYSISLNRITAMGAHERPLFNELL